MSAESYVSQRLRRHPLKRKLEDILCGIELFIGITAQAEVGNLRGHVGRQQNVSCRQVTVNVLLRAQVYLSK